jgi:hypothetical protein
MEALSYVGAIYFGASGGFMAVFIAYLIIKWFRENDR